MVCARCLWTARWGRGGGGGGGPTTYPTTPTLDPPATHTTWTLPPPSHTNYITPAPAWRPAISRTSPIWLLLPLFDRVLAELLLLLPLGTTPLLRSVWCPGTDSSPHCCQPWGTRIRAVFPTLSLLLLRPSLLQLSACLHSPSSPPLLCALVWSRDTCSSD